VGTCNWLALDGTALYAQVIDSKGIPISSYTTVPAGTLAVDGSTPFVASIPFTTQPMTSKGYLILIPATQIDSTSTVRIPLTFKR
jgi:hypothetical protein